MHRASTEWLSYSKSKSDLLPESLVQLGAKIHPSVEDRSTSQRYVWVITAAILFCGLQGRK